MEKAMGTQNTAKNYHLLSNFVITVNGDTATAWSRWAFVVPGQQGAAIAQAGRYDDELVRENGRWKFKKRVASNDTGRSAAGRNEVVARSLCRDRRESTSWSRVCSLSLLRRRAVRWPAQSARIDDAALRRAGQTGDDWLTYGLNQSETRFSPLKDIDTTNVTRLGLAWSFDLQSGGGGQEATPLVANGAIYGITNWSVVIRRGRAHRARRSGAGIRGSTRPRCVRRSAAASSIAASRSIRG